MKKLSIIIPLFNESEREIFPLLSSIDNSLGINFNEIEVIIVNDHSNKILNEDFLNSFNNIKPSYYLLDQNVGPGVTRQIGIERSNGEYVMFCDADDIIHSVGVLGVFLHNININDFDILTSKWIEELVINNQVTYINHENEFTWMHGKVIKKSFLLENNIKFDSSLRVQEDSYFLGIVTACTNKVMSVDIPTYVWKYNTLSITRSNDSKYTYSAFPEFVIAISKVIDWIAQNQPKLLTNKIFDLIIYCFITFLLDHWGSSDIQEYVLKSQKELSKILKKYSINISENQALFNKMYSDTRNRILAPTNGMEKENIMDFINKLK